MDMVLNIISWISMVIGVILLLTAVVGAWRFPDAFTKAHALSLIDTAGALFMFIAMACHTGFNINLFKIVFIVALLWFASAINGHLTIKTAIKGGFNPTPKKQDDDLFAGTNKGNAGTKDQDNNANKSNKSNNDNDNNNDNDSVPPTIQTEMEI